jgi:hypothetical protein
MRRLLILSCSERKRHDPNLLPAIDRYDGPAYRVLRKYLREQREAELEIYILSAEFGLIRHDRSIPDYNHRMTLRRARDLRAQVLSDLAVAARSDAATAPLTDCLLCMGKTYHEALRGVETQLPSSAHMAVAQGGQGAKLGELKRWLYGGGASSTQAASFTGTARVRGRSISLTAAQAIEVARRALARDPRGAGRCYSWYVPIDGQRVAPKWLVSQLTGLPANAFVTDEARRALNQLGVEVLSV